jgi:peptidoglycan lytic transglycosylase
MAGVRAIVRLFFVKEWSDSRLTEPWAGVTHARGPMYRSTLLATVSLLLITSAHAESGLASYYGGRGSGMTCAHRTRPMGSILTVRAEGRTIQCRVNDRGPFIRGRVIDLSVTAARALGMMRAGVMRVSVE